MIQDLLRRTIDIDEGDIGDTGIIEEDEYVLEEEGNVLQSMSVDARLYSAIRQFRNPQTGYSEVRVFQRVYMGYDEATGESLYGRINDGDFCETTRQALEDFISEQQINDGEFLADPRWIHLLPRSFEQRGEEDDGRVWMTKTSSESLPSTGVGVQRFAERTAMDPGEDAGSEVFEEVQSVDPTQVPRVRAHRFGRITAMAVVEAFIKTDFFNPDNRAGLYSQFTLGEGKGAGESPQAVVEFQRLLSRLMTEMEQEKTPGQFSAQLCHDWDVFVTEHQDQLYMTEACLHDGLFLGGINASRTRGLGMLHAELTGAFAELDPQVGETQDAQLEALLHQVSRGLPMARYEEIAGQHSGQLTVGDIYSEFLPGFWGTMEDYVRSEMQQVPDAAKETDVQTRFGIDHWYDILSKKDVATSH